MDLREALYTTRAMRRVRPDPIPTDAQARILDAAIRAPSGGNMQNWRFLLVDDPAVKAALAPLYQDSMQQLWATIYRDRIAAANAAPDDPASAAKAASSCNASAFSRSLGARPSAIAQPRSMQD